MRMSEWGSDVCSSDLEHRDSGAQSLRQLFDQDPERGHRLAAEAVGIYFDYYKNRVTDETLKLLLDLARQRGLEQKIAAMFAGEKINATERRANRDRKSTRLNSSH